MSSNGIGGIPWVYGIFWIGGWKIVYRTMIHECILTKIVNGIGIGEIPLVAMRNEIVIGEILLVAMRNGIGIGEIPLVAMRNGIGIGEIPLVANENWIEIGIDGFLWDANGNWNEIHFGFVNGIEIEIEIGDIPWVVGILWVANGIEIGCVP